MKRLALCVGSLLFLAMSSRAGTMQFSGFLNDSGNTALIGSDLWTGGTPPAPGFVDDLAIANNVARYSFVVGVPGTVSFVSTGFAAGGADPYFTLFSGTGATAAVVGSNYLQAISTGGDFSLNFVLAPGPYTVTMGVYSNLSFAENLGAGALGDGFIGLGVPQYLGSSYYALTVIENTGVPEPSTLIAIPALFGFLAIRHRNSRPSGHRR